MTTRKIFFNKLAEDWDTNYNTEKLLTFLSGFVPQFGLQLGDKVLDVGCGTGILIPFLIQAVGESGHITAVDFADKMIEKCKSKYAHLPNVDIVCQEIEDMNLPSDSYDVAVCFGVFPHLQKKERALSQMNRVLKVGGKLIIAHALSRQEINKHHHGTSIVTNDGLPVMREMKKLLRQSGFGKVQIIDKPGKYLNVSIKLHT